MRLTRRGRAAVTAIVLAGLAAAAYAVTKIVHYVDGLTWPGILAAFDGRALLLLAAVVLGWHRAYRAGRARQRIAHSIAVFKGHPR